MILKVELSEHEYNNIMAVDSINLGRMPYKGIVMSAINAIKRGEVQEPTPENDLGVDWESYKDVDGNSLDDLILDVLQNNFDCGNTYGYKVADEIIGLLPSVTPQEPIFDKIRAEKLLDDLATQEEFLCKMADDASGYTRSGIESIRTSYAKTHEQHAKEYRQILRYLVEYRLMQADYEARLKVDMVAMLTDIQLEIEELKTGGDVLELEIKDDCKDIIQQKINMLKAESEEKK